MLMHGPSLKGVAALGKGVGDRTPLVLMFGESNSGGFGLLGDLSDAELAPRASVKILDNTSLIFADLDVGTNNLVDHTGITDNSSHGWEVSLANAVEAGRFGFSRAYLVKAGQGGSSVGDWATGQAYWDTLLMRVAAAKTALAVAGVAWTPYVVLSLGINSALFGGPLPTADYKAGVVDLISRVRTLLGAGTRIALTNFTTPPLASGVNYYNATMAEIAAADPLAFVVDTSGTAARADTYHWTSASLGIIGERLWDALIGKAGTADTPAISADANRLVTITGSAPRYTIDGADPVSRDTLYTGPFTAPIGATIRAIAQRARYKNSAVVETALVLPGVSWEGLTGAGVSASGATLSGTTANTGAQVATHIDATQPFAVEWDLISDAAQGAVVGFLTTESPASYNWASGRNTNGIAGMYSTGTGVYRGSPVNGTTSIMTGLTFPSRLRLQSSGQDILYRWSSDGKTWTTLYTAAGVLAGKGTIYARALFAGGGSKSITMRVDATAGA